MLTGKIQSKLEYIKDSDLSVRSVNWHVWPHCNYECKFCFAQFQAEKGEDSILKPHEGFRLISRLVEAGMEKITFVGGEPLLCPWLGEYLEYAKDLGCLTMVVTNGSFVTEEFLQNYGDAIDWIGVSIDSGNESTEQTLGRGGGDHLSNLLEVTRLIHYFDIRLKVNVTVTRCVLDENLHEILEILQPERLKFLQVLPVKGQNDEYMEDLAISPAEFYNFVRRHKDLNPIGEDNEMMMESYVMVDPLGKFLQNTQGTYKYSEPILEVGVWEAFRQVGFSWKKLVERGGSDYFADLPVSVLRAEKKNGDVSEYWKQSRNRMIIGG